MGPAAACEPAAQTRDTTNMPDPKSAHDAGRSRVRAAQCAAAHRGAAGRECSPSCSNLLLPASDLCAALAVGWAWPRRCAAEAVNPGLGVRAVAWRTMLRWVVPAGLAAVFVGSALVG